MPVSGVLPYLRGLRIAEEDSVSLDHLRRTRRAAPGDLEIAIVRLPRISNYDEFDALDHEPGVVVRYVEVPDGQKAAGPPAGAPAVEYRLGGGRGVTRTGEASFQTVDGLLNLKVLDP